MGQTDPVGGIQHVQSCLSRHKVHPLSSRQSVIQTPHSQSLPEYFKKLRLMWKGNHLVLLEYVLNPGFGKRWISSPYRKNFPSLGAQSCARHGGKELVRVLPWFPAQSQVPVPEVPLPGGLSQPSPAASPVWCSVLWKTFPVIASCRIPHWRCSAAAPGAGVADAVHAGRIQSGSSRSCDLGTDGRAAALAGWQAPSAQSRAQVPVVWGRRGVGCVHCLPTGLAMAWGVAALSSSSVRSAEGTREGNCPHRVGADRCEHLREERDMNPQERLWVGALLLQTVVGSVLLTGMGGEVDGGTCGLRRGGKKENEGAWPRCWLCRWGLALSEAWMHPENWRSRMRLAVEKNEGSKRRHSSRR